MLTFLTLLAACGTDVSISKQKEDHDGDGYSVEVDCDDAHTTVNPDADEVCDGLDNDCDGVVDGDPMDGEALHADADGDGAGDPTDTIVACEGTEGLVTDASDCDDGEARAYPGNAETCDGIDNDCDGEVDEDATDFATFYADEDGDGYGEAALTVSACDAPEGYVSDGTDCDDADTAIHPDADEADCTDPTDYNCDGSSAYADADGDGVPACEDCDDADAARSRALVEVCDAFDVDEDCDGAADDLDDPTDPTTWSIDRDSDGYGDPGSTSLSACEQPAGYVADATDCDDADTLVNPGATEVCDAADDDEDCDGLSDDADVSVDAASWTTWHRDADGDTYGDPARTLSQCDAPAGYVNDASDCDDTQITYNPAGTEVCDPADADEDCDGLVDEADPSVTGTSDWYTDTDGDGHGSGTGTAACEQIIGSSATSDDCDDGDAAVNPDAMEVCDAANADEDCDGLADDADTATGEATWYRDADADGYGLASSTTSACDAPSGYTAASGDCDDAAPSVNPAAAEVCDSLDDDCDGLTDDADPSVTGTATWYRDVDADGYGSTSRTASACAQPSGYVAAGTDCDDADATVSPAATEVCDAADTDEDCDGAADDADSAPSGETTWHRDQDADTYGSATVTTAACDLPAGYVANGDDCDDYDATAYVDSTWYRDADGDGYGDSTLPTSACGAPVGYVSVATDCDDGDGAVSPGEAEVCANGIDDDCDGEADEDCSWAGIYAAEDAYDAKIYGESGADLFGTSVSGGFDYDGDGVDDLVVGAPGDDDGGGGYGAVYLYTGDVASGSNIANAVAEFKLVGTATYADLGQKVWGIHDLDSDGDDEFVAYGDLTNNYSNLVLGPSASSGTIASADYTAARCDEAASGGDSNSTSGDDEWLCSQQAYNTYAGATYVYTSYTTVVTTLTGESLADYSGYALSGGEDFDGDGYDDYVIGAPGDDDAAAAAGAAYIVFAPVSGATMSLASADVKLTGSSAADYFGYNVLSPGDMDGDGLPDLLVGAEKEDSGDPDSGGVYFFSSPSSGSAAGADAHVLGAAASDYLGNNDYCFMSAGDADGDGMADLLVGSSYSDPTGAASGQAWLVYGSLAGTYDLATDYDAGFQGPEAGDGFGTSGTLASDLDADGRADIVITAPYADGASADVGAVYVYYGR